MQYILAMLTDHFLFLSFLHTSLPMSLSVKCLSSLPFIGMINKSQRPVTAAHIATVCGHPLEHETPTGSHGPRGEYLCLPCHLPTAGSSLIEYGLRGLSPIHAEISAV